ncbi:hypothetical protein LTR56_021312 [Elasticomyces elasticus]|nr:hypothetical protein LTR56_021312 [Elasticomyces elasticus]KAK3662176.1 hypothetical protein LTR22_006941 [Elasticomyces elasticus]KAK4916154.1 hypothetical protein LTR49_015795 [Elasticomyces elasticus]KAK5767940.1 hypothetical protein LTS12_001757 [Elasticomyces elasticus]
MDITPHIKEMYGEERYSDVTLRYSGQEIKAHQVVLAATSSYFAKAFEGSFKEASTKVLELHEDDPVALSGLIALMYGHEAYSREWFRANTKSELYEELTQYVLFLVNLYVAAQKYLVKQAPGKVLGTLGNYYGPLAGGPPAMWRATIEHVYIVHAEAAAGLRHCLVEVWLRRRDSKDGLEQSESAQALVAKAPEFAVDVLTALGL